MRYVLLVCGDENVVVSPEDHATREAAFASLQDELRSEGVLLSAERFCPATTAATVQVWGGDMVVANGPFAETREQVGGMLIVEGKDLDHATQIASRIPAAWYGTIEVRPVWETPPGRVRTGERGGAMRYALLICHDENVITGTDPARAAGFNPVSRQLGDRLLGSARLRPTTTATTVRVRDGGVVIADGPFAETKEQIAGFLIVECADRSEALKVACQLPVAHYGTIEVRPVWESS